MERQAQARNANMSKIRKKATRGDVHIILGDPLPLSYDPKEIKDEGVNEEEETAVESQQFSQPIRRRVIETINRSGLSYGERHSADKTGRDLPFIKPSPISIKSKQLQNTFLNGGRRASHIRNIDDKDSNRLSTETNYSRDISNPIQKDPFDQNKHEIDLISSIENNLFQIRKHLLEGNKQKSTTSLEGVDEKVKSILLEIESSENKNEGSNTSNISNDLIQELERLQKINERSRLFKKLLSNYSSAKLWYLLIIVFASLLFFSISFILSGLNYQYCYYFC